MLALNLPLLIGPDRTQTSICCHLENLRTPSKLFKNRRLPTDPWPSEGRGRVFESRRARQQSKKGGPCGPHFCFVWVCVVVMRTPVRRIGRIADPDAAGAPQGCRTGMCGIHHAGRAIYNKQYFTSPLSGVRVSVAGPIMSMSLRLILLPAFHEPIEVRAEMRDTQ